MHHPTTPPVLVIGATGAIGREVVRALLERGARVRVLVRDPGRAAHLPPEVERVTGTLDATPDVARALHGVQAAFYVSPHEPAEETYARNFLAACEAARVRLVFAGVHIDGRTRLHRAARAALFGLLMPHYRGKMRLAERIRRSPLNPVVLIPGNYYQNDELCLQQIMAGTYPIPMGRIGRVDTRDVGDAAARALLDPAVRPGAHAVVAPTSVNGLDAAATWSAALGRAVQYRPDMAGTDRLFRAQLSGQKQRDFSRTYRLIGRLNVQVSRAEAEQTTALLGRPARTHAEYVRDTLRALHQQAAD